MNRSILERPAGAIEILVVFAVACLILAACLDVKRQRRLEAESVTTSK